MRVWAPLVSRVELEMEGRRMEMSGGEGGWWHVDVEKTPGARYGFSLDGSPILPDPRSPSQPDGVHQLSETVDHHTFAWSDHRWKGMSLPGSVLYEVHVGTFTPAGSFDSAIERLPHLVELGVDAVEIMPVAEFPGERGWGYDGVDLFAPHHGYGGPDGLKRLVDACHAYGIGVVLDVVYNHIGPDGNYLTRFGPYFSDRHHTDWGAAVNFDGPWSDEVRRFVIDNAEMWLRDYHCDGLRLDAVHAIIDESATHILADLADAIDALGAQMQRPLFLIAESDRNDPRLVGERQAGGLGVDAVWADDWHHALHTVLTDERDGYYRDFGDLAQLAKALRQAWVYDGIWSEQRRRRHGASPAGLPGHRFVVSTQNHDQVGNRARGERSSHLANPGRLRVAAALLLTTPFTPMLFQGEEWAASTPFLYFTDHQDPDLAEAVSNGRREEFSAFGWDPTEVPDPQDISTFLRSRLRWEETDDPGHARVLDWYRDLIALRRRLPELRDPRPTSVEVTADPEKGTITVTRGRARVLVNLGRSTEVFAAGAVELLVGSEAGISVTGEGVAVPPDSVAVVASQADG